MCDTTVQLVVRAVVEPFLDLAPEEVIRTLLMQVGQQQ